MKIFNPLSIIFLLSISTVIESARILAVLPLGKSHYQFCINVIKTLAEHDHEIVVLGPYGPDSTHENIQYAQIKIQSVTEALPRDRRNILQKVLPFILNQLRTWYIMSMVNLFYTYFDLIGRKFLILYVQNEISMRVFEDEFDTWSHVGDLEREVSLVFFNSHYSMSGSKPYLPNMVEIGGLHIKDPEPLPLDIQTILDKAINGSILFSFGSILDLSDQPKDVTTSVLRALGRLNQTVILKWHSKEPLPEVYDNIFPFSWLPQNDILAHPNTKAFVTHGGLNSQQEAVHHGVPIVCVPFFGDQPHNCLLSQVKGFGIMLPYSELNEESLFENLKKIISNEQFKTAAVEISRRFQDRPLSQKESIVFWTEFVLRHKGADFIKGPKRHMYWFQTTHLDVVFFLVFTGWVLKKVVGFLFRILCQKSNKQSREDIKLKIS